MQDVLALLARIRVAVIGDMMLDAYLSGGVARISPEAPVPVVRVAEERLVPGGAANVAANLAGLGVSVALVGLTGADTTRDQLADRLSGHGRIDMAGLVADPGRRTTRKLRIIGARQQIVRVDEEDARPIDDAMAAALIAAAEQAIAGADVVILSDYGKGVCSDALIAAVIAAARAAGRPVFVDPKRTDFAAYRGAALLIPNRKELADATRLPCEDDAEAAIAAAAAQAASGADILLTRSEKGMSFFAAGAAPFHLATVAQAVFDVSGAGDTVVAVLAAARAIGMPWPDALRLANHAAGIVVSKLGTAVVEPDELAAFFRADAAPGEIADAGLVDRARAVALRQGWRAARLTVGFTNGCFDLLHPGHVALLAQAAASCDRLIVALNTDASVRRLKGPARPIQDEAARAAVMAAIKGVAAVVLFDEDTPAALIEALLPDVLVKGADYREEDVVGAGVVRAAGGRVVLATLSAGRSTTGLVAAARQGGVPA